MDGSSSKDDDRVISYHWELQQGPIGYQPNLVDTPTLQLNNLIAGNYTFKLVLTVLPLIIIQYAITVILNHSRLATYWLLLYLKKKKKNFYTDWQEMRL